MLINWHKKTIKGHGYISACIQHRGEKILFMKIRKQE